MPHIQRVVLSEEPFKIDKSQAPWDRGRVNAHYISHPESAKTPFFAIYKLELEIKQSLSAQIHVTGDERYEFWLNSEIVGRGSERGDFENWYFESYDLELPVGKHEIQVFVWSLGNDHAPYAQFFIGHSFLCVADDESHKDLLTTGFAPWKCAQVHGVTMIPRTATFATGDRFQFDGKDFHADKEWIVPTIGGKPYILGAGDTYPQRTLKHGTLPEMYSKDWQIFRIRNVSTVEDGDTAKVPILAANDIEREHQDWQDLVEGKSVTIPANTRRRVLIDCENYLCSYWHLRTNRGKGSQFRIHWQESLYEDMSKSLKGNRNAIEGKFFGMVWHSKPGCGDLVIPGGQDECYRAQWWLAGRFIEIYVQTGPEPLTMSEFRLEETRYPLNPPIWPFQCSDEQLNRITDICLRALQMDAHETYTDSPYYEQLMYVGDTRVEAMMTMALTDDAALPRKATEIFKESIGANGLTQSRYPCRNRQYIAPFSLWWVLMVADQHLWRGDAEFVRSQMLGVRSVLSAFGQLVQRDEAHEAFGLVAAPEYWNFVDWVPEWQNGIPPGGENGYSVALALQLLLAVEAASELESLYGYAQSHRHYLLWATELRKAIKRHVKPDGFLRDAVGADSSCEQVHALAVLTNDAELRAIGAKWYEGVPIGLEATYYFQHYRHEALARLGKFDVMLANIREHWGAMLDNGLVCTLEQLEPSRSDCHAWASHPLYHFQSKVLGLAPLEAYRFEFRPNLCDLDWAEGYVSTGKGPIHARVDKKGDSWVATIVVPDGVVVSIPDVKGMVSGPKTVTIDPS